MLEIKEIAHRTKVVSAIKNRAKPGSWKPISKSINNSVDIFRGQGGREWKGRRRKERSMETEDRTIKSGRWDGLKVTDTQRLSHCG